MQRKLKTSQRNNTKDRIATIDTLKAWAIFVVVLSHNDVMDQGGVGNCIFFAVSGFMAVAPFSMTPFEDRFTSVKSVFFYWLKRIVRIIPPFWVIVLCANLVYPDRYFESKPELLSFLFLKDVEGHIWFLQNTMVLYFLVPFIGILIHLCIEIYKKMSDKKDTSPTILFMVGVVLLILSFWKKNLTFPTWLMTYRDGTSLIYFGTFGIGMAFAFFWRVLSTKLGCFDRKPVRMVFDIVSLILFLFPVYTSRAVLSHLDASKTDYHIGWSQPLLCALVFAFLILLFLWNEKGIVNRVLSFAPFSIMGKVSFGIYLAHWYILPLVSVIANIYVKALVCYVLSLGIAVLLYVFVERPLSILVKTKSIHSFIDAYTKMDIAVGDQIV